MGLMSGYLVRSAVSLLLALDVINGRCIVASMYAAYDALPARLKEKLDGRLGAFTYGGRTGSSNALVESGRSL